MKYFNAIVTIPVFALLSCNNNDNKKINLNHGLDTNELKKEIIFDNNKESYGIFLDISANDSLNYESLALSLVLADRGDINAKHMVFYHMVNIFNKNKFDLNYLGKLSDVNKNFALHYLNDAARLNNFSSQIYLEELYRFGIGVAKNETKADSILSVIKKDHKTYKPLYEIRKK